MPYFNDNNHLRNGLLAISLVLASISAQAGFDMQRTTTLTDDQGGTAVTQGQGRFEQPGAEFTVTATLTDFMPREDGARVNGQLTAVSSIGADSAAGGSRFGRRHSGGFARHAANHTARTTVVNGAVVIENTDGEVVELELVDLQVNDRAPHLRRQVPGQWSGTVVVNGTASAPEALPRPIKGAILRILGLLRH